MSCSPALATTLRETFYPASSLATPEEIAPKLLSIIEADPERETVEGIAEFLVLLAHENPKDVETFVRAIRILEDDPVTLQITIDWYKGHMTGVRGLMRMHLHETIADALEENNLEDDEPENNEVDRWNPCLTASILAAAGIKLGLMELSRVPYAITRMGLQVPDPQLQRRGNKEKLYAVSACLHMLVAGSVMMRSFIHAEGYKGILEALELLKAKGVLDAPDSQALLEVRLPQLHILTPALIHLNPSREPSCAHETTSDKDKTCRLLKHGKFYFPSNGLRRGCPPDDNCRHCRLYFTKSSPGLCMYASGS
jgi:hypothetical protein